MKEMLVPSEESTIDDFELKLNESAKGFLKEAAKWAYFLSILGYIGISFIVLAAIFAGTLFSFMSNMSREMGNMMSMGGSFITALYLIIATLYFFPIYYLNRFASNLRFAFRNNDSEKLAKSFGYLKSHYKFIGVLAVIMLCFYALIFAGVIIAAITVGLR
ncbi:hypothetical protein [Flavobacterium soyangense]|uniref:DUF5362 domain-containing protein n=1 Tax=Flavobacterium soyangense TaxID=2023265 RepID=A0A930XTK8_9FLAO|nr:hypothetical protein [Flavobacterium soyangense]MBF2707595.1 hypothetical protein [Flavobacterium soyangense]